MKKLVLLLFWILSSLTAYTQEDKQKFDLGISIEPAFGYFFTNISNLENYHPRIAYSGGISVGHWFSQKIRLEAGLGICDWGEKTIYNSVDIYDPMFVKIVAKNHYYAFQIPVDIEYYWFSKGKVSLGSNLGVKQNLVLKFVQRAKYTLASGDRTKYRSTNSFGLPKYELSLGAGIPVLFSFSAKNNLRLRPTFNIMVTNFGASSQYKWRYYSTGLNVTYLFGLKK